MVDSDSYLKLSSWQKPQVHAIARVLLSSVGAYGGSPTDARTDAVSILLAGQFAPPTGDNHHNAAMCPYCSPPPPRSEEGEYQVGAVVAYVKDGGPHLAWREPGANQENRHHWHVFHGMAFGWRTWSEIQAADDVRFLGVHE